MKFKRLTYLLLPTLLSFCALFLLLKGPALAQLPPTPPVSTPDQSADTKLDPALLAALAQSDQPTETIRFIVHLAQTANLQTAAGLGPTAVRRANIVQTLQDTAVASQTPLRQQLSAWQTSGLVTSFEPFWIVNAIAVTGQPEVVYQLAADPAVARIMLDQARPLLPPTTADSAGYLDRATAVATADQSWGVASVRAPWVWHGLGIDGAGVTVAIMDSGVDWQHPDLLPNYRGNLGGGLVDHTGNWYNTAMPTITVPFDQLGHGTHVAGTAVGQNGLGVAPGAAWIAVNIANEQGLIYDSAVHAAFQWLLAPAGDVALAPDIINGSWGGPGWLNTFVPDIQAIHLAGILTVFAAGNSGPDPGSLLAPASIGGVLAVGASDETGELAWFSSRGPSILTPDYKPAVTAPGTRILSALPGGLYGYLNGTSMATPHVSGAAALLLSANPGLDRQSVTRILTETAVPLPNFPAAPNMAAGWGEIDAYAAVATQTSHGTLTGLVQGDGRPLAGITVTLTTPDAFTLTVQTDGNGRYTAALQPGIYQVAVAAFGFNQTTANGLAVQANQTLSQDFNLDRPPSGALVVSVRDSASQAAISATLTILDTPLSQTVTAYGKTAVTLPTGAYTVRLSRLGYRLANIPVLIAANQTHYLNVDLDPGPRMMLVHSGDWYYRSVARFYQTSLTNLDYAFDYWPIRSPLPESLPTAADLSAYDTVIWAAPEDSPGYVAANEVITDYLGTGGSMLITGQNAAYYDGQGFFTEVWWADRLQAQYLGKTAVTQTLTGAVGTVYDGLAITLNGGDSADNQAAVDVARPRDNALTDEIFWYADGRAGGLQADQCRSYHLTYLGFGLEGVSRQADREAILARTFSFFQSPPNPSGIRWLPPAVDDFAPGGATLVYPLTLQNLSETMTDTFSLAVQDAPWQPALSDEQVTIGPCETAVVTLTLSVPSTAPKDAAYDWTLTAVSPQNPGAEATLPIHHKVPGTILLVDDDRWYNQESLYRTALAAAGFSFDEWAVGWDGEVRGSPTQDLLNAYDYVIWYTGYDWFQPLSSAETARLENYLAQGGRLFLSSQDFLYYHRQSSLAQDYLGVLAYQESITPTQVYRANAVLPPAVAGPLPLVYGSYKNFSDGLIAAPGAEPFLWHDQGMAAGVATQGLQTGAGDEERPYRAIFWGIPFEKTPVGQQPDLMNGIIGWLSDLGDSTFEVDRPVGAVGDARTFTITVRNFAPSLANQVSLTNTLPPTLAVQPATLTGGAAYDPAARQIRWSGELAASAVQIITYQAVPLGPAAAGQRLDNQLELAYARHGLTFKRVAALWLDAPDLNAATLAAEVSQTGMVQTVTYTLAITNVGLAATPEMTAVLRLPDALVPITDSLHSQTGLSTLADQRVRWQGSVAPGETTAVSIALTRTINLNEPRWVSAAAYLVDGLGEPVVRAQITYLPPYTLYFPLIAIRP